MSSHKNFSRRQFIGTAGAVAAGALFVNPVTAMISGAKTKQKLALVGTGSRGTSFWGKSIIERYPNEIEFVGLCDINPGRVEYAKKYMGVSCPVFTNFEEIRKNIKKLLDLKDKQEKKQLSHYTKREQLFISRKINKFDYELGGVAAMDKLPDAIFVVDGVADKIAIKEARETGVKVLGISDTNADPMTFDYPVPANDDGIKSIKMICETVIGAYIEGKKESGIKTGEKAKTDDAIEEIPAEISAAVAEEAALLEEVVEKEVVEESSRKTE